MQPNTAGTQYKPSRIDLTGGTLRITSTAGKSSGGTNTQDNALQVHVDASRSDFTVQTRILGPMSDLTLGYQQKAMCFGPDQQNFLKTEIEHRTDTPGVFITLFKEEKGVTGTLAKIAVAEPAAVSTLDFQITGDMETGTLDRRLPDQLGRSVHPARRLLHACEHLRSGSRRRVEPASSCRMRAPRRRSPGSTTGSGCSEPAMTVLDRGMEEAAPPQSPRHSPHASRPACGGGCSTNSSSRSPGCW